MVGFLFHGENHGKQLQIVKSLHNLIPRFAIVSLDFHREKENPPHLHHPPHLWHHWDFYCCTNNLGSARILTPAQCRVKACDDNLESGMLVINSRSDTHWRFGICSCQQRILTFECYKKGTYYLSTGSYINHTIIAVFDIFNF